MIRKLLIGNALMIVCFAVASVFAQTDDAGLKKINGTSLFLSVKGSGDPLIVIHGGPGLNHSYFIPYLQGLEKKLQVIYYDQRACGRSLTPSADSISMKLLVEDIEAIRKELKVEKVNILAHSWGAVLAAHYASQYPDRIKRFIFSNPSMLSREFDQEAAALVKQKTTKADSVDRAAIFGSGPLDIKKYDELFRISFRISAYDRANISKMNLNLPANFLESNRALFTALMKDPGFNSDMYNVLPSFKFPVLIIHGQSDVLPQRSIERLEKGLPDKQLIVFKKSGHFPFLEETDAYNDALLKFLSQ
jgi:proline iminopeptidase